MRAWIRFLRGCFVVFDGPDGSGKSTQCAAFAALCREEGLDVCEVREPGGTPIGEQIRTILLDPANAEMSLRCETLLYMASRAQLVEQVIAPALAAGRLVLADRFLSSTLAYQGTAGGLSEEEIMDLARVAVGGSWPDLTVIFDVDAATAAARLARGRDRMERKGDDFHGRVRQGYLEQARRHPQRHLVIDARGEEGDVFTALCAGVEAWVRRAG
jgi:dTMP kinase